MLEASFFPALSGPTQTFIRTAYGLLMLATLGQALPQARRFFLSERWGGYAQRGSSVDWRPVVVVIAWIGLRQAGVRRTSAVEGALRGSCDRSIGRTPPPGERAASSGSRKSLRSGKLT